MFAIEVNLLTGQYGAAHFGDRDEAEWPPHPARLYSALVAAWAYEQPPLVDERTALAWLAEQGAPEIVCSDAEARAVVTHYVPVNDAAVVRDYSLRYQALVAAENDASTAAADPAGTDRRRERAHRASDRATAKAVNDSAGLTAKRSTETSGTVERGLRVLPERRGHQARTYPVSLPEDPRVCFRWPESNASPADRRHLDDLASRVHRLGHSSSLVSCRVIDNAGGFATWLPRDDGNSVLRTPAGGLLELLESAHRQHRGQEPRTLPAALVPYAREGEDGSSGRSVQPVFGDDWLVFAKAEGPSLPIASAMSITSRFRAALLDHADDPAPELLSGHVPSPGGQPSERSERPHVALVALPNVGNRYADGSLLGIAVVFPRSCDWEEREVTLRAIGRWRSAGAELTLGRAGIERLTLVDDLDPRWTLRPPTWCRSDVRWNTVTPVALDRFPRHLFRGTPTQRSEAWTEAESVVAASCAHIGLPIPTAVALSTGGPVAGVPPARTFPAFRARGGRIQRLVVHARLTFASPVCGPVLIGAGRYLGYGLCRPVSAR
jgi:CRISPR-associated protein Csb2